MAKKSTSTSRQASANRRAQSLGFKNDYARRKFKRQHGISGIRNGFKNIVDNKGNHLKIASNKENIAILQAMDLADFKAAKSSGGLAKLLGFRSKAELDRWLKQNREVDEEFYKVPAQLKTLKDYKNMVSIRAGSYKSGLRINGIETQELLRILSNYDEWTAPGTTHTNVQGPKKSNLPTEGLTFSQFLERYHRALHAAQGETVAWNFYKMDDYISNMKEKHG